MKALFSILIALFTLNSCATYKKMRAGEPLGSATPSPDITEKTTPVQAAPAVTPPTETTPNTPPSPAANPATPTVSAPPLPAQPPQPAQPDHKTTTTKRPIRQNNSPFIQPDGVYNIPNKDDLNETTQPKTDKNPPAITVPKN